MLHLHCCCLRQCCYQLLFTFDRSGGLKVLYYYYYCFGRYVAQGRGILQPHHLIDELDKVVGKDEGMQKLRDSPLSNVLKSAQVWVTYGGVLNVSVIQVVHFNTDVYNFLNPCLK